jgi:hypothetical protein
VRKALSAAALAILVAVSLLLGFARSASAQDTFTFVCQTANGTQTFSNLTKPNPNSAVFTNGTTKLVSAIGATITGGTAQSMAASCTVNGEGPFPFLIIR